MTRDWYSLDTIDTIDTPALVVYLDQVKENIEILKTFVPDTTRLRPHIKTHKSPEITKLLMDAGIRKFKCATIAEAEMMGIAGAPDVLLAYQPVGPKAQRFAAVIQKFPNTHYACIVDDLAAAQHLSAVMKKINHILPVYIDLNVGMNRTGIEPGRAFAFFQQLNELGNLRVAGLHAYDGHLRDPDIALRTQRCNASFAAVEQLHQQIRQSTGTALTIVAGGTPTFPIHSNRKDVECSPGTFIYWDKGYQSTLLEQPFHFAALVVTRVVSKPADNIICVDLGHKSIASENPLTNRVTFLNAPDVEPVGHSEEHMVLKTEYAGNYQVGDVLYGVPFHVCPTVALHDTAIVAEENRVVGRWNTEARDKFITI